MDRSWGARGAACMMSPKASRLRCQQSDLRGGEGWSLLRPVFPPVLGGKTRGQNRTVNLNRGLKYSSTMYRHWTTKKGWILMSTQPWEGTLIPGPGWGDVVTAQMHKSPLGALSRAGPQLVSWSWWAENCGVQLEPRNKRKQNKLRY